MNVLMTREIKSELFNFRSQELGLLKQGIYKSISYFELLKAV